MPQSGSPHRLTTAGAVAAVLLVAGCHAESQPSARFGGDPQRGEQLIRAYGCVACHTVPGIQTPRGVVGPPLASFAKRTFIAGITPNTPANLARWVMNPQAIHPATAMPAVGLNAAQAQDVAAFLLTLD
jgi:cytochrome c2